MMSSREQDLEPWSWFYGRVDLDPQHLDVHRLESYLRDELPKEAEKREPLLLLARCGTPARLVGGVDDDLRIRQESHRLSLLLGLPQQWLISVVAIWARALGGKARIPRQQMGEISSAPLPPIDEEVARKLRQQYSSGRALPLWQRVPAGNLEATLHDLLPAQPGVQERILLLHRCGSLQRLSIGRKSVLERFRRESSRLQEQLKFPKQWLEAGINDVLTILSLPRVEEPVAVTAIPVPTPTQTPSGPLAGNTPVPIETMEEVAQKLREQYSSDGVSRFWEVVSAEDLEATLHDLLPAQPGVPERISLLHRCGSLQRLSNGRKSVLERFRQESLHLQDQLQFPQEWIEAGINDVLTILSLPRVEEVEAAAPAEFFDTDSIPHLMTEIEIAGAGRSVFCRSVSWSPNGRFLASGSYDNHARIWSPDSGSSPLHLLKKHSEKIWSVCWSPDGDSLISTSRDKTWTIWNASSGTVEKVIFGHKDQVNCAAWSPVGRWVATGSSDRTVRIWSAPDGNPVEVLKEHSGSVRAVAWSPDGTRLATASFDRKILIFNFVEGSVDPGSRTHSGPVTSLSWSPDGRSLASGSYDKDVRVWNLVNSSSKRLPHGARVHSVNWSPDGRVLASADAKGMVHLWSSSSWEHLDSFYVDSGGEARSVCWSPDGQQLACASSNGRIGIWTGFSGVQVPAEVVGTYFELQRIHPEQSPPTSSTAPSGDTSNGGCGCGSVFWIIFWAYILLFMVAKFIGS